jgi:hypothetical protein
VVEDRCSSNTRVDYNTLTVYDTFLVNTVLPREVYTMFNTGGDTATINQLNRDHRLPWNQLGPQGEVHGALPISVWAVGLPRDDLTTAAFIPFQPPLTGQDRERDQPAHTEHDHPVHDATHAMEDTSTLNSDNGLFATILPAKGFGLDLGKLPIAMGEGEIVGPVSQTIAASVSMGEEEIVGTEVRRPTGQPLYTGHCTDVTWRLQLRS